MKTTDTTYVSPLRGRMMEQMGIAGLADSTQAMYLREIETLNKHYNKPPDRLDAEEVRSWLLARIERGLDPNTTNVSLGALRFLYRDTLRRPEMVDGLRYRKRPRKLPRSMAEKEVERLILAISDLRYRAATVLAYGAGLRISETVEVQLIDIKSDKRLLHIRSGKGGAERMAPLPDGLVEYLRRYCKNLFPRPVTWLFYGESPEVPLKIDTLRVAFKKACRKAGVDGCHTFHSLRHSAATHWHERGGNIDVIQDVLGHRNADTTRGYARATGKMFETLDHPLSGFDLIDA